MCGNVRWLELLCNYNVLNMGFGSGRCQRLCKQLNVQREIGLTLRKGVCYATLFISLGVEMQIINK